MTNFTVAKLQILSQVKFFIIGELFQGLQCRKMRTEWLVDLFLDNWRKEDVSCSLLDDLKQQLHSPGNLLELFIETSPLCVIEAAVSIEPNLCLALFVKADEFLMRSHRAKLDLKEVEGAKCRCEDGEGFFTIEIAKVGETEWDVLYEEVGRVIQRAQVGLRVDEEVVHLHQVIFHCSCSVDIEVFAAGDPAQSEEFCCLVR